MLNRARTYGRFVKIEHSVFAFPLLLAGVLIASGGWPSAQFSGSHSGFLEIFLIILAGVGARTVAFALNRVIDQKIDALNPRTVSRELPSGAMTLFEAVIVGLAGLLIYLAIAFILMRVLGLLLALIPLSVFAIYPFLKRFTSLAHFGVGLSLALAPLAGWLVATANLSSAYFSLASILGEPAPGMLFPHLAMPFNQAGWLTLFTFFWVSGFDIIYSTLDEDFDRSHGLHSLPAKLGRKKALWISAALHGAAFVTLAVLYVSYFRTPVAGVLLSATGVLLFLEQYLADNIDLAFFKINGIISFVILAFIWAGVAHL